VRHDEIGIAHFLLGEANDVEIQRSRTPALATIAPRVALDALECREQGVGIEGRFDCGHLVQICALEGAADRSSLLDVGHAEESRAGKSRERRTPMREVRKAVTDVRAERDEGDVAHAAITRGPEIAARDATASEKLALTRREATGIVGACQTRARQMDSLTMHYVARELADRCRERRIVACHPDPGHRTLTLWWEGAGAVAFDLAALAVREANADPRSALLHGWMITDVTAPTDERRLVIAIARPGKFRGSSAKEGEIEISFIPNARGARVREARRVIAMIGAVLPRVSEPRPILDDAELRNAIGARDDAALLRGRWMSTTICRALYAQPERAVEMYHYIVSLPSASPTQCGAVIVPLPLCEGGTAVASLILPPTPEKVAPESGAIDRRSRAAARMRRELETAREAPRVRALADALMALGDDAPVPPRVELPDGTTMTVPAPSDARETPVSIAARLYRDARAMERAIEQLPGRIAALAAAPEEGTARRRSPAKRSAPSNEGKRLPYKSYRSSGGIEILVGRGARSNDELTYDIARPDDVWLHARDVTGAHVVMRWTQTGAPPTKDLHEAAALAAWHSRARGSVVVPVDWTRRRYVRRARGGPPGRALVERVKTVMARPSAELERRLRADRSDTEE